MQGDRTIVPRKTVYKAGSKHFSLLSKQPTQIFLQKVMSSPWVGL
ncbi:hypothetical protein APH_0244 [Anaplasma phagocytophilum str. HZ]|uniref:Uncharacterized protein n=1 Tax=Anaplasma phagocytophilum (strain HZ) TaxID=212042 RepID=Q2GL90_ANAPZ|nr:hypothetical protein APH_0244 [Anaplasma phagocytophilum str. HZ]